MADTKLTPDEIADHRAFLAKITASSRADLVAMLDPRQIIAAQSVLDGLIRAAQDEIRFIARIGLDVDADE
jgi:hypothetical protein